MLSSSGESLTLESIAGKLLTLTEQLHLIHWQTNSYAEHVAVGEAYDYVHDFKDSLMEKLMGYTGRKPSTYRMEPIGGLSATSIASEGMSFASSLKQFAEANGYLDIGNMADDFSGHMAKLRYLLTLS